MEMKGNEIAPTRYVIFQPAHDDFLGRIDETDEIIGYGWTPHPANALKYETLNKAETVAHDIVATKEHSYRLEICELHETEGQFGVKPVAVITPEAARHNPDLN